MQYELTVSAYDLICALGDKEKFIEKIAKNGGTKVRIFYLMSWDAYPNILQPWLPYVPYPSWNFGYADGPELTVYDLTKRNPDYWLEFDRIHQLLKKYGLKVQGVLQDRCTMAQPGWKKYLHPFNASIQKRDPYHPDVNKIPGGLWGVSGYVPCTAYSEEQTMQKYHKQWTEDVVGRLNSLEIEYDLEMTNEYWVQDEPENIQPIWWNWYADYLIDLRNRGFIHPSCKIIGSAISEAGDPAILAEKMNLFSVHCVVKTASIRPIYGVPNAKIFWSGDGGYNGSGPTDKAGRAGLGVDDVPDLATKIMQDGYALDYEYLSRSLYKANNDRMTCDDFYPDALKVFAEAWGWLPIEYVSRVVCSVSGELASEYCPDKLTLLFPSTDVPTTVCSYHKKPEEPEEESCFKRFIKGKPFWKWAVGKFIKCLFGG